MKETTYKLKYPFKWDEKEYTEIKMQRPKGKHIKKLSDNPNVGDLLDIAAKCSGILPRVFDEMDVADSIAITEVVADFLASGREIGAT